MNRNWRRRLLNFFLALFLLSLSLAGMGMAGRGGLGKGELRAEIRLKLYDEAIRHYEKAQALHQSGHADEALREIRKAKKVVNAFPEACDLARRIYLERGQSKEALEEERLWRFFGGDRGSSLYRLRDKVIQEIEFQKKSQPPPDFQARPALLLSGCVAGILIFGMVYEYWRFTRRAEERPQTRSIFLERFPDEEREMKPSWLFKLCVLLLPAPFFFSLLVLLGLCRYSDLLPLFLLAWVVADVFLYLIYLADLSGLGDFRRPGGMA